MEALLNHCLKLDEILPAAEDPAPIARQLRRDPRLREAADQVARHLHMCGAVFAPQHKHVSAPTEQTAFKAVAWNIERGKHCAEVLQVLKTHPELRNADFYLLTEVDWGMARSGNRNITADLGEALELYAYFAPSYYNFTKGHGTERYLPGKNRVGLHGKSILSRYPLKNLRTIPMPNAIDKLNSKESRLGQKHSLRGELQVGSKNLSILCAHLDAFSSPRARARQLYEVAKQCQGDDCVLLGGDWNTNTLDSTSTLRLAVSVLHQLLRFRPKRMVREHHTYPERYFDRAIFQMLQSFGFEFENCNEIGVGTYDLVTGDHELGTMAKDQFSLWSLKAINRLIKNAGGNVSLKLDWFAAKNLYCLEKKVVKVPRQASDHHPILLTFNV